MAKTLKQLIDEQFSEEKYKDPKYDPYNKIGLDGAYITAFINWLTQKYKEIENQTKIDDEHLRQAFLNDYDIQEIIGNQLDVLKELLEELNQP